RNSETTGGFSHQDTRRLYCDAMREAKRISRHQVWVKCKDEIALTVQHWSHCELLAEALALGLYGRDLVILVSASHTNGCKIQRPARKPHSYLWVFELPSPSRRKHLERPDVFTALRPTCG